MKYTGISVKRQHIIQGICAAENQHAEHAYRSYMTNSIMII